MSAVSKQDATVYLMNPHTGSVDTRENWLDEMPDWETNAEGSTPLEQFASLVEVVRDEQGDWIEPNNGTFVEASVLSHRLETNLPPISEWRDGRIAVGAEPSVAKLLRHRM